MSGWKNTGSKVVFVLVVLMVLFSVLGKAGLLGNVIMKAAQARPWWKIAIWIFMLPFLWYTGFGCNETMNKPTDDPADE